jgi:hypothetical protein
MQLKDNPLLKQENYAAQYEESIKKLRNHPETIEFDKICYELFIASEMGRKFMEIVMERYLLRPSGDKNSPNYGNIVIWGEGFKEAFLVIRAAAKSHEQRIKSETNK